MESKYRAQKLNDNPVVEMKRDGSEVKVSKQKKWEKEDEICSVGMKLFV